MILNCPTSPSLNSRLVAYFCSKIDIILVVGVRKRSQCPSIMIGIYYHGIICYIFQSLVNPFHCYLMEKSITMVSVMGPWSLSPVIQDSLQIKCLDGIWNESSPSCIGPVTLFNPLHYHISFFISITVSLSLCII